MSDWAMDTKNVDPKIVDKYLKMNDLEADGDIAARVTRLATFYEGTRVDGVQQAKCTICEGRSPAVLKQCPFCGDKSIVVPALLSPTQPEATDALSKALAQVQKYARASKENLYATAQTLAKIQKKKLWKLRKDEDGQQLYKGFYDCIHCELGMSKQAVSRLISIQRAFDRKQFKEYGVTTLGFALRLPAPKRVGFLRAMNGKPKRGAYAAKLVKEIMGGNVIPVNSHCNLKLGAFIVPMYRGDDSYNSATKREPSVSLEQNPWLEVSLSNDTRMYVRLTRSLDGTMQAIVEVKRADMSKEPKCVRIQA